MVSAAQALIRQPQVFLFDEPISALDLRRQLELLNLIRAEAKAHNTTAFVALHDLNLAARFADVQTAVSVSEPTAAPCRIAWSSLNPDVHVQFLQILDHLVELEDRRAAALQMSPLFGLPRFPSPPQAAQIERLK